MVHRPTVQEGQWVEKGDILADNSSSHQGELAIGQNILVGIHLGKDIILKTQCYLVND
jgi:DNA-directed RNA polymerase beta subunit